MTACDRCDSRPAEPGKRSCRPCQEEPLCFGCGQPMPRHRIGDLACSSCWTALPADLRSRLAAMFRARTTNPGGYAQAKRLLRSHLTYRKASA